MLKLVTISNSWKTKEPSEFSLAVCDGCRGPNCCEIEPPFLTRNDINNVACSTGLMPDQFAEESLSIENKVFYQMRKGKTQRCHFYDQPSRKCGIYESRPIDCRLFPLDIIKIQQTFAWIMYSSCPVETPLLMAAALEMVASAVEKLLPLLANDIAIYANLPTSGLKSGKWIYVRDVQLHIKS